MGNWLLFFNFFVSYGNSLVIKCQNSIWLQGPDQLIILVIRNILDWLHISWRYYYLLLLLFIILSFWMTYSISKGDTMCGSVECWINEIHQSLLHKIDKADWNGILILKILSFRNVCCTILHAYLSSFNIIDSIDTHWCKVFIQQMPHWTGLIKNFN